MNTAHGSSIAALLVVLAIAWAGVAAFYIAAGARRLTTRRQSRRAARMSRRTVQGLGADLLRNESMLRHSSGGQR